MKWIKCSERLPEKVERYVIRISGQKYPEIRRFTGSRFHVGYKNIVTEWLDDNDDSDEEMAFNAGRLQKTHIDWVGEGGGWGHVTDSEFVHEDFTHYKAEKLKNSQ